MIKEHERQEFQSESNSSSFDVSKNYGDFQQVQCNYPTNMRPYPQMPLNQLLGYYQMPSMPYCQSCCMGMLMQNSQVAFGPPYQGAC